MRLEMSHQTRPPRIARRHIAQRVKLQRHAVADPQLAQQLIGKAQQFHIRRRFRRADHFGIQLMKLPEPPLLRPFITKQRPVRRDLQRRILLPPFGQISPRNSRRKLRPKRQRIPATVFERIHFLRNDIGRFAQRTCENRSRLKHRNLDPSKAIQPPHAVERLYDMVKAVGLFADHALRAANRSWSVDTCHWSAVP